MAAFTFSQAVEGRALSLIKREKHTAQSRPRYLYYHTRSQKSTEVHNNMTTFSHTRSSLYPVA
eukprot:scaffold1792_cov97-Skeletonema_marinoi.AAC.1